MLHSLTLGLPHSVVYPSTQTDVDILNNLHCPRLRTLILNESISILSLNRLLSYPIARLDLGCYRQQCVTMRSTRHLCSILRTCVITDNSGVGVRRDTQGGQGEEEFEERGSKVGVIREDKGAIF